MNREEFLNHLAAALNGEVPAGVIQENLRYYDEYIRGEAAKGRSEEEVIEEIGGYRLIARTIIDANGGEETSGGYSSYGGETASGGYSGYGGENYSSYGSGNPYEEERQDSRMGGSFHMYDLSHGWKRFIIPVVLILVIMLVFSIIGGIFTLLSPILGPLIIVFFLVSLFKNRR